MRKQCSIYLCLAVLLVCALPAMADSLKFEAQLTGDEEVPMSVVTDTTGKATFKVNRSMTRIQFELEIEDGIDILAGPGAHIHCAPFGSNGPIVVFLAGGLPVGWTGDVEIEATLTDANIINDACGATIAELVEAFLAGDAYVNVHSAANPGGEVRGQIFLKGGRDDDSDDSDDSDR